MNTEQYTVIIDIAISRNCRIVFVSRTDKTKHWLMQCERTRDVITETPWLALCLISDPIPPPPPHRPSGYPIQLSVCLSDDDDWVY